MKSLKTQFEEMFTRAAELGKDARISSFVQDAVHITKEHSQIKEIQKAWVNAQEENKDCGLEHKGINPHLTGLITSFGLSLKEIKDRQEKSL